MASPLLNQPAPDFTAQAHNGQEVRLGDYRGKRVVVLYFYPMDGTPVCTKEACSFRDAFEEFTKLGAVVIGVSGDSPERHQAFAASRALPFLLLSDRDGSLRKAFQVPKTLGILPSRVTYVIDKQGVVRHVFSALFSGKRHVAEALKIVRELVREDNDSSTVAAPAPPRESDDESATCSWEVWRQGDDGNPFLVRGGLTAKEADDLVALYESRGHKQVYWRTRRGGN